MKCDEAERLMMLYMDKALDDHDTALLKSHANECPDCKKAFDAYARIMTELSIQKVCSPPIGFEDRVMERVYAIDDIRCAANLRDNLFCVICAAASVIIGMITAAAVNIDALAKLFGADSAFIISFNLILTRVSVFLSALPDLTEVIPTLRYILLLICLPLAGAQYFIFIRNKANMR